jgi:hypothetical protein
MQEKSYFNRFLPLGGNLGTQQMATFQLSPIATSIDLRSVFGSIDNGDGIMVKADGGLQGSGWRAYVSFTEKATPINEAQTTPGTASGAQCWPLLDGQELLGHLTSGRAIGTGFATQLSYTVMNMKASFGSGAFKLMRHTLVEPQDASRFQSPVPNLPSMIASGMPLGLPSGGWNPRP